MEKRDQAGRRKRVARQDCTIDLAPWQRWAMRGFVFAGCCAAAALFLIAGFLVWIWYVLSGALH